MTTENKPSTDEVRVGSATHSKRKSKLLLSNAVVRRAAYPVTSMATARATIVFRVGLRLSEAEVKIRGARM
jgi:hypothetical protein